MKSNLGKIVMAALAAVVLVGVVAPALAGDVYDRKIVAIGSTGAAKWTNEVTYSAIDVKRLWFYSDPNQAADTVTLRRISTVASTNGTAGSTMLVTQSLATVVSASNAGSTNNVASIYGQPGDVYWFTTTATSSGWVYVEFEVQQH